MSFWPAITLKNKPTGQIFTNSNQLNIEFTVVK
jgi:hypothetical protein